MQVFADTPLVFRLHQMIPAVILGLVPRIQPSARVGANGWMDGRDKPDHDNRVPSERVATLERIADKLG
jgi:hypothetical protein